MTALDSADKSVCAQDFEHFFEKSISGFIIADRHGVILKGNDRIGDWIGISAEQLQGKRFSDLLAIGGKIYYETHLWPLLRMQGFFDEVLIELTCEDKQKMSFLVNAIESRDENNNPECIYYILSKAEDRITYEKNLQRAKQLAEAELIAEKEMVTLREQLIAVLGHDLRNPLASTLLATEMLGESLKDEKHSDLLGLLKRSALRMNELIENIMDFAKTRMGGGINIEWQHIELQPVLQQVVDELSIDPDKIPIVTTFEMDEPVYCDPDRMAQLVSNLLANALTHGASNSPVLMHVSHRNGNLEFSIRNKGEKIPEDLMEHLFEPFTREGKRKSQNGLGLGLYISAEIARAHQATLTCTSTTEETCFTFYMSSPI